MHRELPGQNHQPIHRPQRTLRPRPGDPTRNGADRPSEARHGNRHTYLTSQERVPKQGSLTRRGGKRREDDATLFYRGGGARGAATPRKSAASPEPEASGVATPPSGKEPRDRGCAAAGPLSAADPSPRPRAAGEGEAREVARLQVKVVL